MFALDTCVIIELSKNSGLKNRFCQWVKDKSAKLCVCESVIKECKREQTISTLEFLKTELNLNEVKDPENLDELSSNLTGLGEGELATIFLCEKQGTTIMTFDRKAIITCKLLGVLYLDFKEEFISK